VSGNDEKPLSGAPLHDCMVALFEDNNSRTRNDFCYRIKSVRGTIGYINCDLSLRRNGGPYNRVINFMVHYELEGIENILKQINHFDCNVCGYRIRKNTKKMIALHELLLEAIRQGDYDFSE
jgi:hypothetical protein